MWVQKGQKELKGKGCAGTKNEKGSGGRERRKRTLGGQETQASRNGLAAGAAAKRWRVQWVLWRKGGRGGGRWEKAKGDMRGMVN